METYIRTERANYNLDRERNCGRLGITVPQYNRLRRYSEMLRKWNTLLCNGEIDDGTYESLNTGEWRKVKQYLQNQGVAYCREGGLYFYYQNDPRGCALYLDTKPISGDTYDQAVAIY